MRILKNIFSISVFAATPFLLLSGVSMAQTEFTSFVTDVGQGVAVLAINSSAQTQAQAINGEDYKSTWDEFGMNVLIDGTISPNEVDRAITEDIIRAIQAEKNYDQQETQYLTASQTTPEEIQNIEGPNGSDVPPGEFIDPNPSAEANTDVSMSASEDRGQNNLEEASTTENASPPEMTPVVPEAGTSTTTENTSTPEMTPVVPEAGTSTPATTTSSEETIFNAILQGELVNPPETPSPPEPSPAEYLQGELVNPELVNPLEPPSPEPSPTE